MKWKLGNIYIYIPIYYSSFHFLLCKPTPKASRSCQNMAFEPRSRWSLAMTHALPRTPMDYSIVIVLVIVIVKVVIIVVIIVRVIVPIYYSYLLMQ